MLVALAIALFGARNGARSLTGLNIAFGVDGPRGFLGGNLMALAITAAGIAGLVLTAGIGAALANIAGMFGSIASFLLPLAPQRLPLVCSIASLPMPPRPRLGRDLAGRDASLRPGRQPPRSASMPRISAATTRSYGALGAVVALITWFWATGFLTLLGGELVALRNRRG